MQAPTSNILPLVILEFGELGMVGSRVALKINKHIVVSPSVKVRQDCNTKETLKSSTNKYVNTAGVLVSVYAGTSQALHDLTWSNLKRCEGWICWMDRFPLSCFKARLHKTCLHQVMLSCKLRWS